MNSIKSLFSKKDAKSRLYIHACHFDPGQPKKEEAWILFAQNEEECIFDRVISALHSADSVVVIDQQSSDGTPYFAAEAGAVVIIQSAGQSHQAVLQEAIDVARRMASNVRVCS